MMRWIVGSSIKFRRLVIAVSVGLLVYGVLQLDNARTDILPEFQRPTVEVQTEALGLSAEEVEELITVPLEQDLLVGIAFLEEIESVSLPGLSSVVMTFEPGTSVLDARQVVGERLTQAVAAAGLPQVAKPPQMIQPVSSTSRVAMVKLSSDELTPIEMSILSKWVITPRLLGVEGVANVSTWGFRDRQLQVLVDPQRLDDADVTLNQIIRTAGNALEVSPLSFLEASSPGTGGFIDTLNERLHIFHEQAISTPDELEQVPIEDPQGEVAPSVVRRVSLGDVTDVVVDHQPLIGDALCSDGDCLLLVIEKFPDANTPEVAEGVDGALEGLSPGLPGLAMDTSIYRPAEFIDTSFDNLGRAALIGAILLILVLGALFFDWRTALVSTVAIAMSLAAAWLVLYFTETTVNTMILAGLVMALVVLIDDAVIDVDNVAQRVRQQRAEGDGTPAWQVIIDATLQMRSAILFATLIVAAVLLPAFFMEGEAGAFLPTIATAYLLAIVASIVVAITVTPALGMMLLGDATRERRESPVARWLHRRYEGAAARIVPKAGPAFAVFGVFLLVGLVALPFLDQSMRPVAPGARRGGATGRRTRHLAPTHGRDHGAGRRGASVAARHRGRGSTRRSRGAVGSDRERQLRRGVGQRRRLGRLRRHDRRDRVGGRRPSRRHERRADVLGAADHRRPRQGRRRDRRPGLRPEPGCPRGQGGGSACGHRRHRRDRERRGRPSR